MEYLEHGDLHHYLAESPPLPELEAGDITFQILEGLSFMHENHFAHRDLKPAVSGCSSIVYYESSCPTEYPPQIEASRRLGQDWRLWPK